MGFHGPDVLSGSRVEGPGQQGWVLPPCPLPGTRRLHCLSRGHTTCFGIRRKEVSPVTGLLRADSGLQGQGAAVSPRHRGLSLRQARHPD